MQVTVDHTGPEAPTTQPVPPLASPSGRAGPQRPIHSADSPRGGTAGISEFLAFKLGSEEYGIDILRVQEIRSFERPTRIANAPDHILGVLNLRGLIVPIVDLRLRFGLGPAAYGNLTVTIVLSVSGRTFGVVVDAVSDVITLSPEQLRPAPDIRSHVDGDHLMAIGIAGQRMLMLMDIGTLISSSSMGLSNGIETSTTP